MALEAVDTGEVSGLHAESTPRRVVARRSKRRRVSRRGWVTLGSAALLLVAGATYAPIRSAGGAQFAAARVVGTVLAATVPQPKPPAGAPPPMAWSADQPFTILVMSNENQPQDAGPQLTDSMMLMSYDPGTKSASLFSVPRDLWIDIPGYGYQRINTALEYRGFQTAELAVEQTMGVPIEYYAIVDYKAFVKLVNDLGGINVDVPYSIDDTCYPNQYETKCTTFQLSAGPHHLDGATALQFARERHVFKDGDIQRERDQQLVLLALKTDMLKPANLRKLPTIIGDLTQLVQTNVPYSALPTLALEALHVNRSAIQQNVLSWENGAVTTITTQGGAAALQPHPAVVHALVSQTFSDLLGHMDTMPVQVENGAPTSQDLATYFTGVLRTMGVQTLTPEQAARTDYKNNHVYVNTAVAAPANGSPTPALAYILGHMLNASVQQLGFPSSRAPIVVILGSAFPTFSANG